METLFEKFGIKIPERFEDYNLIGVDFGDGEISASFVNFNERSKKMTVKSLAVHPNSILLKNANAFYINPNVKPNVTQMIYDVNDNRFTERDGGIRYYNFKKCPGDLDIQSKFVKDDGIFGALTYQEVMVASFSCLVNILFKSNEDLSREKPSIILVGRPSSIGWRSCEKAYAKMLQDGLELPTDQAPVYIVIQSESTAALATELDAHQISRNEVVVVLDSGSSTFDITVIDPSKGGIVGESSCQFGGNQLDENLLKVFLDSIETKYPGAGLITKHGHKLGLRQRKELYYGLDGRSKSPQIYQVLLSDSTTFNFEVNEASMNQALDQIPVRVFHFQLGIDGRTQRMNPVQYDSWLKACKAVYKDFYQKMKPCFRKQGDFNHPVVPDRIILSGGVSIMPEVQDAVKEAFGVMPTLTDRPNYAVSIGLGYMLGTEVRKRQLLENLIRRMNAEFPGVDTVLTAIGDAGEDEEWDAFNGAMKEWAEAPQNGSLYDFYELWGKKYFNQDLTKSIQRGAERWYKDQNIQTKLTNMLRDTFKELFPEFFQQFKADLPSISFSGLKEVKVSILVTYSIFAGEYIDDATLPRDKQTRQKYYQHFLSCKDLICKGGKLNFPYTEAIEKGWIFKQTKNITRDRYVTYDGIRSMYINANAATPAVAEQTRKDILARLEKPLEDFVESITPYFDMTARRVMDVQ